MLAPVSNSDDVLQLSKFGETTASLPVVCNTLLDCRNKVPHQRRTIMHPKQVVTRL